VVINTQHLRLKPPEYLNKHEAAIWSEVVNATDPQHALENDILGHRSNPSEMSAGQEGTKKQKAPAGLAG
jgi:hypothetical protein